MCWLHCTSGHVGTITRHCVRRSPATATCSALLARGAASCTADRALSARPTIPHKYLHSRPDKKLRAASALRHRFAPTRALLAGFLVLTVPTMFATIRAPSGSLALRLDACSRTHQLSDCGCGAICWSSGRGLSRGCPEQCRPRKAGAPCHLPSQQGPLSACCARRAGYRRW